MTNVKLSLGDVILFEADESCISQLICELSECNVSHAAMYYDDKAKLIIEEGLSGIQTSPAPGGPDQERKVYVRRHKDHKIDLNKVIAAAEKHLKLKQPYSISNLVLVGGLLITGRFIKEKKYITQIINALTIICTAIAVIINKKTHPGQLPMTCSQLVTQCYTDAGKAYQLKFDNKMFGAKPDTAREDVSLAELALARLGDESLPPLRIASLDSLPQADYSELNAVFNGKEDNVDGGVHDILDKICCAILKLVRSPKMDALNDSEDANVVPDELLVLSAHFAKLVQQEQGPDPAQLDSINIKEAWHYLQTLRNFFVSPADLMEHCTNLEYVGVIEPPK